MFVEISNTGSFSTIWYFGT